MNTSSYHRQAFISPVEGIGRFFLLAPSSNLPLLAFCGRAATALISRGLQRFSPATTFQHLPVEVEGPKILLALDLRGFQPVDKNDLPDLPDIQPLYPRRETSAFKK